MLKYSNSAFLSMRDLLTELGYDYKALFAWIGTTATCILLAKVTGHKEFLTVAMLSIIWLQFAFLALFSWKRSWQIVRNGGTLNKRQILWDCAGTAITFALIWLAWFI